MSLYTLRSIQLSVMRLTIVAIVVLWLTVVASAQPSPQLEAGFRDMYNLQFDVAHAVFHDCENAHPADPMPPAANAAAYLFAEFDRLHILESEFFTNDTAYVTRQKLAPDPETKRAFLAELDKSDRLSTAALAKNADDPTALFSRVMVFGLRGDYAALIEKRDMAGLGYIKTGRALAERLLTAHSDYYDAYLAVGVENYLLGLKPAPMRWFLRITGAQTDRDLGLQKLRITAEKGHYLLPYARLLLAVAALRDKDTEQAKALLAGLADEFPSNHLYARELAKLQ